MKFTCCFCGQTFYGFGNNPYPVNKKPDAQCCFECNKKIVIPARVANLEEQKEKSKLHRYGLLDDNRIIELFNSDGSIKHGITVKDGKTTYEETTIVRNTTYQILIYDVIYDSDSPEELEQLIKSRKRKVAQSNDMYDLDN